MMDPKDKPTPPVEPYKDDDTEKAPAPVEVESPRSTDAEGEDVVFPDLGGQID